MAKILGINGALLTFAVGCLIKIIVETRAAMDYHVNQSAAALVQCLYANREIEADPGPLFLQSRNPTPVVTI